MLAVSSFRVRHNIQGLAMAGQFIFFSPDYSSTANKKLMKSTSALLLPNPMLPAGLSHL
jgi:hypothetical protein